MTKEEMALRLNGRECGSETTKEDQELAAENDLVIVYGYSDDLMEMEGAVDDEFGCYEGGVCDFDRDGIIPSDKDDVEEEDIEEWVQRRKNKNTITAVWCGENLPAWCFKTKIPHATFEIMDDGEVHCRGIVFNINDLK